MPSLVELIVEEHNFGPDKPDVFEIQDRKKVLTKLRQLPVSEEYSSDSFLPHDYLQDLVSESPKGTCTIKNKFERFLDNCQMFSEKYLVYKVIEKLAFPKVFGRKVCDEYYLTIENAQDLLETGSISKLDGFDNEFNLEVAKKLFSSK